MTINNETARQLMYDWQCGQWSPLYAAASSGLVQDFGELYGEVNTIEDAGDKEKLQEYLDAQMLKANFVRIGVTGYLALPWARL